MKLILAMEQVRLRVEHVNSRETYKTGLSFFVQFPLSDCDPTRTASCIEDYSHEVRCESPRVILIFPRFPVETA